MQSTKQIGLNQYYKNNKSLTNTSMGDYLIFDMIQCGSYGSSYRAMNYKEKKQVVIQLIDLAAVEDEEKINSIYKEINVLKNINCDHVLKIYQIFQNKSLLILVTQFFNGGILRYEIEQNKILERDAIQIIKQIILGITILRQNSSIVKNINSCNIVSHYGIYKICAFDINNIITYSTENIMKDSSQYQVFQIIEKQQYQSKIDAWHIGLIFYQMITGKIENQIMYKSIVNKNIKNNKLSKQTQQFLQRVLNINHHERSTWQQLINQQIFKNKSQLPEKYRLVVDISCLIGQKIKKSQYQIQQQIPIFKDTPILIHQIAYQQRYQKQLQINRKQHQILKWVINQHLQCLKSELIYKDIILQIEKSQMLNFNNRNIIQMMYLLCARCFFNLSFVQSQYSDCSHLIIRNFKKNIQKLYLEIRKKFDFYCNQLKQKEDSIRSIVTDRYFKTFYKQQMNKKQNFLIGIQKIQFKKQQQIIFTYEKYLKYQMNNLKPKSIFVKKRLINYVKINMIQVQDLKKLNFYQKVKEILDEN